ncbi:MAG: DUF4160 domain-containing protein [Candidatus Hydrogenedentota bacterium]
MPTIGEIDGPYRFYFYSFDCNEPPHVHVRRDRAVCKFWLEPLTLARNYGFAARELNRIREIISNERAKIKGAWHEHCGER